MSGAATMAALGLFISVVAVLVPVIVKWLTRRQRRRRAQGKRASDEAARWRGNGNGDS